MLPNSRFALLLALVCLIAGGCKGSKRYHSDIAIGGASVLIQDTSGTLRDADPGESITDASLIAFSVTFYRLSDIDFDSVRRFDWAITDDRGVTVSTSTDSFGPNWELVTRTSDVWQPAAGERVYQVRITSVEGEDGDAENDRLSVFIDVAASAGG